MTKRATEEDKMLQVELLGMFMKVVLVSQVSRHLDKLFTVALFTANATNENAKVNAVGLFNLVDVGPLQQLVFEALKLKCPIGAVVLQEGFC